MVSIQKSGTKTYYICTQCGFGYATRALARQCEQWCTTHHTCNIQITQKAIFKP